MIVRAKVRVLSVIIAVRVTPCTVFIVAFGPGIENLQQHYLNPRAPKEKINFNNFNWNIHYSVNLPIISQLNFRASPSSYFRVVKAVEVAAKLMGFKVPIEDSSRVVLLISEPLIASSWVAGSSSPLLRPFAATVDFAPFDAAVATSLIKRLAIIAATFIAEVGAKQPC